MRDDHGERRGGKRHSVSLDCRIDGLSSRTPARITDLSAGGGYVDTRAQFRPGDRIELAVMLDGHEVVLIGRVVHSQPAIGFGFAIDVDLPEPAKQCVEAFVRTASY